MNKGLDCFALTITIIGAINWGLIGFFSFDLVAWLFGNMTWLSRIIYGLVGICGLYLKNKNNKDIQAFIRKIGLPFENTCDIFRYEIGV